jgi:hypothetical protein
MKAEVKSVKRENDHWFYHNVYDNIEKVINHIYKDREIGYTYNDTKSDLTIIKSDVGYEYCITDFRSRLKNVDSGVKVVNIFNGQLDRMNTCFLKPAGVDIGTIRESISNLIEISYMYNNLDSILYSGHKKGVSIIDKIIEKGELVYTTNFVYGEFTDVKKLHLIKMWFYIYNRKFYVISYDVEKHKSVISPVWSPVNGVANIPI